ncbi:unnamed protein product, partial [Prorocentrum cordatum]
CGGPTTFDARADRGWSTYRWSCKTVGHKHFCEPVNSHDFFIKVPVNSWMLFLHLINNFRLGRNFKGAQDEMANLFGELHRNTISAWKPFYQECLGKALPALDALMDRQAGAEADPARLPARTVYDAQQVQKGPLELKSKPMKGPTEKPMKTPPPRKNAAIRGGPAADLKSNVRWLWVA